MTSRGCPYNCIFCSTSLMWKRKWRPVRTELVVQEIEMLTRDYGIKEIAILDDQFLTDIKRVHAICDALIEAGIKVWLNLASGVSPWLLDRRLMEKMKKAGFYKMNLSIETGCPSTVKFIKKPIRLEDVTETVSIARQLGFWTWGSFIIGFPYETANDILETARFARSLELDFSVFMIAQPYAGTELTGICEKEGLLEKRTDSPDLLVAAYDTATMTARELQALQRRAQRDYIKARLASFFNPVSTFRCFAPKLGNTEDTLYIAKLFLKAFFRIIIPGMSNRPFNAFHSLRKSGKRKP